MFRQQRLCTYQRVDGKSLETELGLEMADTVEMDELPADPLTDYAALLRRQLKHGSVWNEIGDPGPEEGIWRVFEEASGTPTEKRLLNAVVDLLKDSDVDVRSGAVGLAQDYAEKLDPAALLQILERNPLLFEGVKPTDTRADSPDLAWGLLHAMTANTGRDPRVLARLRKAAFDTENGFTVLGGLAADDPDWIVAQARSVIADDPVKARIVMTNLPGARQREHFVKALAGGPPSFRNELAQIISDKVKSPAERERLASILA
jgi:hypothetical protein